MDNKTLDGILTVRKSHLYPLPIQSEILYCRLITRRIEPSQRNKKKAH